jgi:hypothetical protein
VDDILVRAKCVRCPWAMQQNKVSTISRIIFLLSFRFTYFSSRRVCPRVLNFAWAPISQNIRFLLKKNVGDTRFPPHYAILGWKKGEFQSYHIVLQFFTDSLFAKLLGFLGFWNIGHDFWGVGEIFKVTLQTCAPTKFRWCRWGAEQRLKCAQKLEQGPPSALVEFD